MALSCWVWMIVVTTCVYGQRPAQRTARPTQPAKIQQAQAQQPEAASPKPDPAPQQIEPQPPASEPVTNEHALPVPRFVGLRATANLHVGPGQQYPVEWQYIIPSFPMEVLAEFGHWRQVRDFQGTRGWLHKSLLTGKRYALIVNAVQNLMNTPHAQGKVLARLSPGVIGRVVQIQGDWCKLSVKWEDKTYKGWIEKRHVWGVYPHEAHS